MASELENRGTYTDLDRPDDVVTYQKSFSQTKIVLAISIVTVFVISLVIIGVVVGVFASDNDTKPKNIIVVLADGLSPSSLTYAREMSTFNSANPAPLLPIDQYLSGHVRVYSANLVITDSAAGATAYSCQKLTNNDFVAVTPDGIACATLLEAAKEAGFVTGIVTNTRVTHATPAAFSAHVPARDFEDTIAQQQAYNFSQSLDLLYGGGLSKFVDNNGENLLDVFAEEGVNVITSVDELESAKLPVVGLFADSHLAYQIDLMQMDPPPEPTLSELVENALDLLSSDDKPFFLFIESGKIDLSAHSNDAPTHYWEVNQYMQVVQTIEDFLSSTKKDTSVVFVSDHATGGITTGRRYDNLSYPEYTWYVYFVSLSSICFWLFILIYLLFFFVSFSSQVSRSYFASEFFTRPNNRSG